MQVTELMTEGVEHHVGGRFSEAVDRYSRVIEMLPEFGEAWRLLGVVALQSGDNPAARRLLERAIRIDGSDATSFSALGSVEESEGKLEAASRIYRSALTIDPAQEAALIGLTRVTLALGQPGEAIAIAQAAVARGVHDAGLMRALGAARLRLADYAGGVDALQAALRIKPHPDAFANLGAAYVRLHRIDEAIAACGDALSFDPSHTAATNTLGSAYAGQGSFPEASAAFERAIALGSEEARVNLGTMRLLVGDYHGGWPNFGWSGPERRANPAFAALPMWDGTPAPNMRLLVWPEQGIGDSIMMARFLRRARELVGKLTLACPPGTIDVFRTVDGVDAVIDSRETPPLSGVFDLWLPTIRLPVVFDISPDSIPATPYIRADATLIERFHPRLARSEQLRVGLVWSGNPGHQRDTLRSCGLAALESLYDIPGVTWFALQQGVAQKQEPRNGMKLVPINAEVRDFADTAAILSELDLLITVDTSVAHLAGALGKPAWVLIPKRPDWRWQLSGDVSPWYPTLRLFRQAEDREWAPVVDAIAAALHKLSAGRSFSPAKA
jgi:tetratricopeptide (TPR) repeat protein